MNMKRILLTSFILVLLYIQGFSQQVPNGSFETWASGEPDNWNTSNQNIIGFTFTTVEKELASPQQGSASARLTVVTKTIPLFGTFTLPGVLTLGILNIDLVAQTASVTGGYPFAAMPQKLTGYYKYQPVNNDTALIVLGLFKWKNGNRDTVGGGALYFEGTHNDWTPFEIPVTYPIWENPDTMNIVILNSNPLSPVNHTGTKMWVDNFAFVYGTVAVEGLTSADNIRIYAERDNRQLVLSSSFEKQENLDISLFSMAGIEVRKWKRSMSRSTEHLDISNLPPGTYLIRITSGNKHIDSRKITILN